VTLSCSGLPNLSQCLFNPSTPVTPGNSSASVVMNISTTASTTAMRWLGDKHSIRYAVWLFLPGMLMGYVALGRGSRKRTLPLAGLIAMLLLMAIILSCGGVSSGGGGGGGHQGTPPGTYTITVTGTSSAATHTIQVTLVVN
jgi:hypothetical protein